MRTMSIIKILSIGKFTLAVFYTSSDCYQYSIIDEGGVVLESDDIFWTPDAAEQKVERRLIRFPGMRSLFRKEGGVEVYILE